jgi:hypothetical protein
VELASRVAQLSNLSCRFAQHMPTLFYIYFLLDGMRMVRFELVTV